MSKILLLIYMFSLFYIFLFLTLIDGSINRMMHEPVFSTNSFSNHFFSQLEDLEKATKCVDLGNCGEKIILNPSMKEELTIKQNS